MAGAVWGYFGILSLFDKCYVYAACILLFSIVDKMPLKSYLRHEGSSCLGLQVFVLCLQIIFWRGISLKI